MLEAQTSGVVCLTSWVVLCSEEPTDDWQKSVNKWMAHQSKPVHLNSESSQKFEPLEVFDCNTGY